MLKQAPSQIKNQSQNHISFIVRKGQVLWWSTNIPKSHPRIKKYTYSEAIDHIHSELAVIIKSGKGDFTGCDLYVVRLSKRTGRACFSLPCKGCQSVIAESNFRTVWYSNSDGGFSKL